MRKHVNMFTLGRQIFIFCSSDVLGICPDSAYVEFLVISPSSQHACRRHSGFVWIFSKHVSLRAELREAAENLVFARCYSNNHEMKGLFLCTAVALWFISVEDCSLPVYSVITAQSVSITVKCSVLPAEAFWLFLFVPIHHESCHLVLWEMRQRCPLQAAFLFDCDKCHNHKGRKTGC